MNFPVPSLPSYSPEFAESPDFTVGAEAVSTVVVDAVVPAVVPSVVPAVVPDVVPDVPAEVPAVVPASVPAAAVSVEVPAVAEVPDVSEVSDVPDEPEASAFCEASPLCDDAEEPEVPPVCVSLTGAPAFCALLLPEHPEIMNIKAAANAAILLFFMAMFLSAV